MALFESIRVRNGRGILLEAHLARLRMNCEARGFPLDGRALEAVAEQLASCEGEDFFSRIYVTGGDGAASERARECRVLLLVEPREPETRESYAVGLAQDVYHPPFGGIKTANYWHNIDALQRARRDGLDETLLFNENAELVSACMANVFLVQDGIVKTPAIECGARQGIVREWVLGACAVREGSLFVADVKGADEIFLTNSWMGIMPAGRVEGRAVRGGGIAAELRARYEREAVGG
jgi:branched-subunit amino acid aminotransferase/4-amino-4-deoxychorismate lyase